MKKLASRAEEEAKREKFVKVWKKIYPEIFTAPQFDISKATIRFRNLDHVQTKRAFSDTEISSIVKRENKRGA